MDLPKTIDPCPIVDALLEVRFTTVIHPNAVFGLIYNELKKDYPKVENLPILQLPDAVRAADPNFQFKPHYKLLDKEFVIQIGPNVVSISSYPEYLGWERFSERIFDILNRVQKVSIIEDVKRLGIRYINFFEQGIFSDIDMDVTINDKPIEYRNTIVRTEIEQEGFISTLQITNNAVHQSKQGSLIDIDAFKEDGLQDFFDKKEEIIGDGHMKEKELFYSLLKEDFLKTLNPVY